MTNVKVKEAFLLAAKAQKELDKRQKSRKWLNGFMGNHAGDILTDDTDELQIHLKGIINKCLEDICEYLIRNEPNIRDLDFITSMPQDDLVMVTKMVEVHAMEAWMEGQHD